MASTHPADVPEPGFDLLEGPDASGLWRKVVGGLLMAGGFVALVWGFVLMLGHTDANVPAQTPVPLQHPLELLGALGLSLLLLCAGAVVLGRPSEAVKDPQHS